MEPHRRQSDRWVTPGVIVAGLLVGGVLVLAVVASVTYLSVRGVDPDPMIRLVANVTAAVGSLGTLLLQLTNRATTAKVERNTGQLQAAVVDVVDELERTSGRHSGPVAVDPSRRPSPGRRTAPAAPGSR